MSAKAKSPVASSGSPAPDMLEAARATLAKAKTLRRDFAGARNLAHQAEVREALTRTELTVALQESLAQRAMLEGRLRDKAVVAYGMRAAGALRRHNRPSQMLDRILARLGPLGQATVIARSGVWRGAGDRIRRLGQMAAYALRGADPAVTPPVFFDQAWYLETYPDVARRRMAPLVHYLIAGGREGRSPHPLFDDAHYRWENALELAATSLTGLEHYVRSGAAKGRNPHPLFDVAHYLSQDPGLAPGEDPAVHYLREGGRLGLSPHPLFDPAWYLDQAPEASRMPALVHYLKAGWRQGHSPHPLFDSDWYLKRWPDVAESGLAPLAHFVAIGGLEGRSPSPWFDLEHYVAQRGDGLASGTNALVDYVRGGAWAVADTRQGFPSAAYIATCPELARSGITPLEHWARRSGR